MKRFLFQMTIFFSIVIISIAIGEYLIRTQVVNPYKYKNEYIVANGGQIETIILGSSHCYYGIKPEALGLNTFNLANPGQEWFYDHLLLNRYLPYLPNLKRAILDVSAFSYFVGEEEIHAPEFSYNYKIYMGIDCFPTFSSAGWECLNLATYSDKLRNLLMKRNFLSCDSLGMGNILIQGHRPPYFERYYASAVSRHTAQSTDNLEKNKAILVSIIELCQENDIEPILVTTPTWESYRNNMPQWQLNMVEQLTMEIAEHYGLKYLNHSSCPELDYDDFFDVDHLSPSGAIKFSKILSNEITSNTE